MDQELLKLLGGSGLFGVVGYFGIKYGLKAIEKLYTDMREQHKEQLTEGIKREDRLMEFLNKKNETDAKISKTLEDISNEMQCMNSRITEVESHIKGV